MPRIPIPAKFEDGDFSAFRKNFERVAKANAWSNEEQLAVLPVTLGGRALVAFEKKESGLAKIEDALKVLEDEFTSTLDREAAMKDFYACQWGVGLDLDTFAARLSGLLEKGLPSLGSDDKKRMLINQFINGLAGAHKEDLRLLFSGKSPTLEEVVAAAKDVVRRSPEEFRACAVPERTEIDVRIDKLTAGLEVLTAQVAAMKTQSTGDEDSPRGGIRGERRRTTDRARIRCFNCSGFGHIARSCPSPRLARPTSGNGAAGDRRPTTNLR